MSEGDLGEAGEEVLSTEEGEDIAHLAYKPGTDALDTLEDSMDHAPYGGEEVTDGIGDEGEALD